MKSLKISQHKCYALFLVVVLTLGWSLYFNHFTVLKDSNTFVLNYNSWIKALLYVGVFLLDSVVISMIFFLKKKYLRWPLLLILLIILIGDSTYKSVNGNEVFYDDLQMVINAKEHISGSIIMYFNHWIIRFIGFSIFIISLSYAIKKFRLRFISSKVFVPVLILSFFATYWIIHNSNGNRSSFPSFQKIINLTIYSAGYGIYAGDREQVVIVPEMESEFNHIVIIVDESIRGDLLQINSGPKENTPFLNSIIQDKLINYGVASSASVCSNASNIILMSGVRFDNLPDINNRTRKAPTLFQYAKKAGFKTAFIDAQSFSNKPDGYMTWDDKSYLDFDLQVKSQFPIEQEYELDGYSLELLDSVIRSSDNSFTYLIKNGSHFPYQRTYPDKMKVFTPTKEITGWDRSQKESVMNSYYNSILWNVDEYWRQLDSIIQRRNDVLIMYTSDHGQIFLMIVKSSLHIAIKDLLLQKWRVSLFLSIVLIPAI